MKRSEEKKKFVLDTLERNPKIWAFYKNAMASFWTVEKVDLSHDKEHWHQLSFNEQHFIKNVLAFFAGSDGIVNENLALRFMTATDIFEVRCFYGFQYAMENIHSEMYSLLIDTLISDRYEKDRLFRATQDHPFIRKKANWALQWIENKDASLGERLVAFAAVEGIFFSGSFCAIFWLKKRGIMPGLCASNEYISRDEGLHCEFACMLLRENVIEAPTDAIIRQIVSEAVEIEKEFVCDSLPVSLIGMNAESMCKYIHFVADWLLTLLGMPKLYNEKNPFDWMILFNVSQKINFFEREVTQYRLNSSRDFSTDEVF